MALMAPQPKQLHGIVVAAQIRNLIAHRIILPQLCGLAPFIGLFGVAILLYANERPRDRRCRNVFHRYLSDEHSQC